MTIAAFHEAGHAVMNALYEIPTQYITVHRDGTGYCSGGFGAGEPLFDLRVEVETDLAGVVSEEIFTRRLGVFVSPEMIDGVLEERGPSGIELIDDEPLDDLRSAVNRILLCSPLAGQNQIKEFVLQARDRCRAALEENWEVVRWLADAVLTSADHHLSYKEIAEICDDIKPRTLS